MPRRFIVTLLVAVLGIAANGAPSFGQAPDSAAASTAIRELLEHMRGQIHARDSLTALADSATGASRELLEEELWQTHVELKKGALDVVTRIQDERNRGHDVTALLGLVSRSVRQAWPGFLTQLQRRQRVLDKLNQESDVAAGAQRVVIESEISHQAERVVDAYETLVDLVLALGRIDVDVTAARTFLHENLPRIADGLVTRVQVETRDEAGAIARLSRDPSNAELRYSYEAIEERLKRTTAALSTAIRLMGRLGMPTTNLRVAQISTTGRVTSDIFSWGVILGLVRVFWERTLDFLAVRVPVWLFQGLLVVVTFLGFRMLSRLVQRLVRRAVQRTRFSELKRRTLTHVSAYAVMLVGFLVILRQLGVQVAPLLAGLGIAGVVVGFAMQSTLSNFAAGGMILGNEPFDVGDEIEVAGVLGKVQRMTLVSTTILTPDNQTLIIPNSTVWGGVIRNRTALPTRRVDLAFGIGYDDDIAKAETVLREIVAADPHVLAHPEPVIKLDRLADSSVVFVVRVWTSKDWANDVAWDVTREVKVRFDREGISFPQREVHLNLGKHELAGAAVAAAPAATEKA